MRVPLQRQLSTRPSTEPLRGPGFVPDASMFGAQVGQSVQNLAASTMAFGQLVRQQEEEKQRFGALRAFSQFQLAQRQALDDAKRNSVPGDSSFYENVQKSFVQSERDFLNSLPLELQDEFKVRTGELGSSLALDAVRYQYEANDTYFKQGIQDSVNEARVDLGQDASLQNLETQRAKINELIDNSSLSEAEKIAIKRQAFAGIEKVAYRGAQMQRLRDEQSGLRTPLTDAVDILSVDGMTELDAQAAAQQGQAVVLGSFGAQSADVVQSLPPRIQAILIATAAKKGELPGSVVAAVTNGDMEELQAALKSEGLEDEADLVLNPSSAIDNNPAFNNIAYEDRLALTEDAEREVAAEVTEQQKAAKAQSQDLVNALKVALYDGTAGQADIDAARERGILTDYDDIKASQEILAKRDEDLRLRQLGEQFLSGAVTYAPGNEDHKKVLNAMIGDDGLEAIDSMDANYTANTLLPIVRKTGAVPENAKELVSGMIRSQDPEKAYWGLDLMSQIERAAPKGFLQFSAEDRKDVDLWQIRKDYMPQDELMKLIRGPMDPAERNSRAALRAEGEKLFTAENGPMRNFDPASALVNAGQNIINEGFPGGFLGIGRPSLPSTKWAAQALENDFQNLFLDHYSVLGDVNEAKKAAFTELQRVWGVSNTGADAKLMKWPPEKVYPPVGESWDWMEAQIRNEGLVADDEQFELLTDTQTENEVGSGRAPSYVLVKVKGGVGNIPLDERGLPLRVSFDYGEVEQADEARWRAEQQRQQDLQNESRIIQEGFDKALQEGIGVPAELFDTEGIAQELSQ